MERDREWPTLSSPSDPFSPLPGLQPLVSEAIYDRGLPLDSTLAPSTHPSATRRKSPFPLTLHQLPVSMVGVASPDLWTHHNHTLKLKKFSFFYRNFILCSLLQISVVTVWRWRTKRMLWSMVRYCSTDIINRKCCALSILLSYSCNADCHNHPSLLQPQRSPWYIHILIHTLSHIMYQ